MYQTTEKILNLIIGSISSMEEVQSIGLSGSKSLPPKSGEGDIDIFIYCEDIPEVEKRLSIMNQHSSLIQEVKINVFEGGHWGSGDSYLINGIETWFMYFTISDTSNNVKAILNGEYLDRLDNYYYPIGRCAMLKNINILYDRNNFLKEVKNELSVYPEDLAKTIIEYHLNKLEDAEDLERAVVRKDVLFYHFALDIAIDHFLQVLFAMNKTYFPSRKRTIAFLNDFVIKPQNCSETILEVVRLGSYAEGIHPSYKLWSNLFYELKKMKC